MMKKYQLLTVVFLSLGVFAAEDFVPLQEKAQGQALAGSMQLNESLYSNPAASSLVDVYSIDGSYSLPKSFAVSILDTKTSAIGGAIGYFRKAIEQDYFVPGTPLDNQKPIQGAKVALMGRLSNYFGIGVAGKSIWGPDSKGKDNRLVDADVGAIFNGGFFQFGAAVRNVLGGKKVMKFEREYSLGGRISYDQILSLSVASQGTLDSLRPYQVGIGAEYTSPYYFGIRGGYRSLIQEQKTFWSVGASFISPKMSLHYALEMPNQPNTSAEHMLGTTMVF